MDNPRNATSPSIDTTSAPGYGFIRSSDTWGVNSIPWQALAAAGLTPALAANDPHLADAIAAGRAAGVNPAIWIPAGGEGLPEQYAQNIVNLVKQYGPSAIIPNIEYAGKGYEGSAGYDWNQRMMNALVNLGMPPQMAVAVLGGDDFNYKAYTDQGVKILPEMFGTNTASDLYDAKARHDRLVQLGVPENLISDLLAPTQAGAGRGSVFTIDDLTPDQLNGLAQSGTNPQALVDTINSTATAPDTSAPSPDAAPAAHTPDAQNPTAVAYAKQRLALLAKQGITADQYGLQSLDPTAQWRALSTIVGARQAISSGHAADYVPPASTPQSVTDYVNSLLSAAQVPNDPASDVTVRPGNTPTPPPATPVTADGARPISPAVDAARTAALTPTRTAATGIVPPNRRVGPMQQAIHTAAGMKYLRSVATRD